jgi:sec-independent protein translocase protein TatC
MNYQLIMLIMPCLTNKERRNVLLALPGITLLFILGVLFAWYVLLPPALTFLNGFLPDLFRPEWTADGYLSFVTSLIFWMGVAFESPLVFFVLSLMGLVTARLLITNWRIAIVGAAIAAAFITPTVDPVNMFLVMGPLMTLYLLSIFLVFIGSRINGINSK